jgi:succinate dehydrogenase/fumarate reductase flavoprotein subunit
MKVTSACPRVPPNAADEVWDVVVVGGGMAGLIGGLRAVEAGARTLILERGEVVGGSARLASGFLAVPRDAAALAAPAGGDPALARAVLLDYARVIRWLGARGVRLSPLVPDVMYGALKGHFVLDPMPSVLDRLAARFREQGGVVQCGVRAVGVARDDAGRLAVAVEGAAGVMRQVGRSLVLASGGFQADPEQVARHVGRLVARTNPYSVGDGPRLADELGAARAGATNGFYGHLLPVPNARLGVEVAARLSQYYSPHCVLLDSAGRRFVDESAGDERNTWALSQHGDATGWLVFDEAIRREYLTTAPFPYARDADRLVQALDAGATVVQAETLEGLAARLAEHGVPAESTRQTLAHYGRAGGALDPPRRRFHHPLAVPPYYALRVVPSIYFTYSGVRADARGHALDAAGRRVRGLFVAGNDVGGVHDGGYVGGLAASAVFGYRVGHAAAAYARRGARALARGAAEPSREGASLA